MVKVHKSLQAIIMETPENKSLLLLRRKRSEMTNHNIYIITLNKHLILSTLSNKVVMLSCMPMKVEKHSFHSLQEIPCYLLGTIRKYEGYVPVS
jgi:hypothetical protein